MPITTPRLRMRVPGARPRVRHVRRSEHGEAPGRARGPDLFLLQCGVPGEVRGRSGPISRAEAGARAGRTGCDLHLPDASRGGAGRSRHLPQVRHGVGAKGGRRRKRTQPRAAGHDPAVLDRRGGDRTGFRPRYGRTPRLAPALPCGFRRRPAGAGELRRAVGRGAVLRARLAVAAHASPQHVHPDRHRHGCGLGLQHRRDARAGAIPGGLPWRRRHGPGLLRGGCGHRCARTSGPGLGAAGA